MEGNKKQSFMSPEGWNSAYAEDFGRILSSEFQVMYYIDLIEAKAALIHGDEEARNFLSIFKADSGEDMIANFQKFYVDTVIVEEDRNRVKAVMNSENIYQELESKTSISVNYRVKRNLVDSVYMEMRLFKAREKDGKPTALILGFKLTDDELRDAMILNERAKLEQKQKKEEERYYAVIKAFSSEYNSINYGELDSDTIIPYTTSERVRGKLGENPFEGMTLSQSIDLYINKGCKESDKELMRKVLNFDYMRKHLKVPPYYYTQIFVNDQNQYCEMKCVKANEGEKVENVVIGFAVKDDEVRREQQMELERQRNFDIIEILASEYTSVFYIDLTTEELNPYTLNEKTEMGYGKILRSGIKFSDAFRIYVDELVLLEDRGMMLRSGSIGNILKELRTKKTFITTFRNAEGHYCEMKFVKVGNDAGLPTAVALGFADKDAELRAKEEEERKLQRNIDIIEILASEYTSVYYIDLTTDELDPYTMNEQTETEFGKIFRSGIKYSNAFQMYVNTLVYEDDKRMMLEAGSNYNILKELSTKKTFITTYRNSEGRYCEMKFVKVGDEENPQAVALGFADKDDEIRGEMKRTEARERDMAVISGLSDDFGCVVYASYETDWEHHYRFDPMFEKYIPGWSSINNFTERLTRLMNTIMHPDDRKAFWEATRIPVVKEALEKDDVYFVNFRTLVNDEITYYQAKFVKDEHHTDHCIIGFHNVDAETKREMDALNRAETASRAKTDFLFNMSHDIRTPMNAIIGFTDIAIREIDDKNRTLECLEKVKNSSNILLALINDILDMSRIESGKVKINEEKHKIEDSFSELNTVMLELARTKDIELTFSSSNIKNKNVFMDKPRVERVLINLVSNAIKYTQFSGWVKANVEQLESNREGYGLYRYTIADNGIGMSEEFQKHMFDEFSREENSTISGIQGTGLGLALAQKLTQVMGGEITCKSKQGEGSTFYVTIPFRLQSEEDIVESIEQNENANYTSLAGKKALVVEDNDLNREIAIVILEDIEMKVETACNGQEAIDMLNQKGMDYYDVVLMDIQMPVMDGYTATRHIRKNMPEMKAPIIALSANAFEEDRQKSHEAGMDDHIAKPINVDELKDTLARYLNRK